MASSEIAATPYQGLGNQYDYSYYYQYDDEPQEHYGLCDKAHVKAFARIFLPIFYAFVCALDIVGNMLLVIVLIKYIKLRSTTSIYLLNMAFSDILFAVTLPFWAVYVNSGWIFGDAGCKFISLIYTINLYSSIFFVTCICMDRYLSTVWNRSFHTSCKSYVICIMVWAFSLLAAAPDLNFVEAREFYGEKLCSHNFGEEHMSSWKIFVKFQLNIFGFLIPFLAMLFFHSRIYCTVRSKVGKEARALKLAVVLVTVFFVLWFPYNVVLFLHSLQDLDVISDCATSQRLDLAVQVTESLAFTHACLNPILYAFVNKRFRTCLNKILEKICKRGSVYTVECTGSTSQTSIQNAGIELTVVETIQ